MNSLISLILALANAVMTVGIMTVLSLLAYKIIFRKFSTKRQLVIVALVMAVILAAAILYGYYRSSELRLSGWAGAAYFALIIVIGSFAAKASEPKPE